MPSFGPGGTIYGDAVSLLNGTVTANGAGAPVVSGPYSTCRLALTVTAVSGGTPSLTVTLETSADGITWTSAGSFPARTTVGSDRRVFTGLDHFVRAAWTVAGTTPSFTVTVNGALV